MTATEATMHANDSIIRTMTSLKTTNETVTIMTTSTVTIRRRIVNFDDDDDPDDDVEEIYVDKSDDD